ncbi:hypothetical protein [Actinoplanes couchii]|uniref:Uncharacterized protein n=1 Tax=Actinoplanes couchii TaxID=403638 RepID=A0ABQ3XTB5_9ACTN|nr:hypothetical protein [Actinoplanes couchii]MDR6324086.1 hypothetical protein [Actinoplanes couchii]GID61612.1 hypothetical protein Aco03nite_100160 [Actinoplanes couchii]
MVSARRTRLRTVATVCPARRAPAFGRSSLNTLPDDVAAARNLIAAGCSADAVRLLAVHLDGLDYAWLPTDPLLIDACMLYAAHTTGLGQLDAARYAHRASHHLHEQPTHPRRLDAAHAYGTALHAHGRHSEAIVVYQHLLSTYRILSRPLDILTTTISLALNLHAAGHCADALQAITYTWHLSQHTTPDATGPGRTIATTHVRMLRACRRDHDLLALLNRHQHTDIADILTTAAAETNDDHAYTHAVVCSHTPDTDQHPLAQRTPPPHRRPGSSTRHPGSTPGNARRYR